MRHCIRVRKHVDCYQKEGVREGVDQIIIITHSLLKVSIEQGMHKSLYATGGTTQPGEQLHWTFWPKPIGRRIETKQEQSDYHNG